MAGVYDSRGRTEWKMVFKVRKVHLPSMAAGCVTGVVLGVEAASEIWRRSEISTAASPPAERPLAPALRHGVPRGDHIQVVNDRLVTSFDTSTRNPRWVLERISAESLRGGASRQDVQFFEDKLVKERFRNRLEDFRGSGCVTSLDCKRTVACEQTCARAFRYDRGHLAPAANHKISQDAMRDTFVLSNISPQVGKGFNRDYWYAWVLR
jgi:DNA/RNA endonuclease G (NUC1)